MRISRKLFLLLLPVMILALTACGNSEEKKKEMPVPEVTPAPVKQIETVYSSVDVTEAPEPTEEVTPEITEQEENPEDALPVDRKTDGRTVVVLDPGHGGKFTGAQYYGVYEKEITLFLAQYIRDYLTSNYEDIEVYLTRDEDIALDDDIVVELEQRAIIAESHGADYFVSLHFNASEAHELHGATVYCSRRDNVHDESYGIAESILKELVALGIKDNHVQTRKSADNIDENGEPLDYYAVIRHNANRDIPGVIVEHCFMDNTTDREFMDTEEKLKTLAEADAKGIATYLGLKLKENTAE